MAKEELMEEEYDETTEMPEGIEVEEEVPVEGAEEMVEFASPTEALAAALKEHGADPQALIDWFKEYGYELVKAGEGGMGEEMEETEEGPLDLVGLRTSVVEKLGPMLGGKQ
jgi:hypothetical protein